MKDAATSDSPTRMGRKPLHLKPVPIRFAPEVLERIDQLAGTYGRPTFIRDAVQEKLDRVEAELKRRGA